jgi:hypothetical protein
MLQCAHRLLVKKRRRRGGGGSDEGEEEDQAGKRVSKETYKVSKETHKVSYLGEEEDQAGKRECCLLVLDSVTSTPQWIRQLKLRGCVHDVCVFVCECVLGRSPVFLPLNLRLCLLQHFGFLTSPRAIKTRSRCHLCHSGRHVRGVVAFESEPVPHQSQCCRSVALTSRDSSPCCTHSAARVVMMPEQERERERERERETEERGREGGERRREGGKEGEREEERGGREREEERRGGRG